MTVVVEYGLGLHPSGEATAAEHYPDCLFALDPTQAPGALLIRHENGTVVAVYAPGIWRRVWVEV